MLTLAIAIEVAGTVSLRQSDGFTSLGWVALMVACYGTSFYLLSLITREMPIGIAYAIWAGAGTALIAIVGVFAFDETLSALAIAGIVLVVIGIIAINVAAAAH